MAGVINLAGREFGMLTVSGYSHRAANGTVARALETPARISPSSLA
jgi:hypothetical protein